MPLAKHWKYNDKEDIVLTQLEGLVASNPCIKLIPSEKVVFNPYSDTSKKIALISGGGAGHEPLHGGYVGENLLDAAVSGHIFASPSTKQIMAAIRTKSDKNKGTIIVVKNYTGDVLHFGLVAEKAKSEGYNVEVVTVGDDVAVGTKQNKMVGRRGLAGTALVHKVLGAATADEKADLKKVSELGRVVNDNLVTMSASLDRTSVPGKAEQDIEFNDDDEAELGLGIHNEPGTKLKPIPNIDVLIKDMFHKLVSPEDKDRHYVDFDMKNDDYVLLINNIGGTSSLELYVILEHVVKNLPFEKKPKRILVSDFVTSLNAPGFSITLLNLSNIDKKGKQFYNQEDVLQFLDTPTNAPGWKSKTYPAKCWENNKDKHVKSPMQNESLITSKLKIEPKSFEAHLIAALNNLLEAEPKITHFDTLVGDGDCGETLAAGANAILKALKDDKSFQEHLSDPIATLYRITELVEDSMGGTSGGIYSIFLTSLVQNLKNASTIDTETVADALHKALHKGLFKYTKARVGGRTLVDTLQPFIDNFYETRDLSQAVEAAKNGCEKTKSLQASFGRASYVNKEQYEAEGGIPDPGAVGLFALIEGFTNER
ncbi:DAK2 [Candida oxycetoniae]|uniref:Dihydroxyacetone kinase n=1 Tax=Candida oxycetoniae TaxID=497107 RepID=A0AAI9STV5_9ASCO|nr:DAK2 [Candida oxycetoniae]KAI3402927.2 DAK2 [Candida oxycetoniae]